MNPNIFFNESKLVERSRSALTNAENHPEIGPLMAEYGMDAERIAEGWQVHNNARQKVDLKKQEEAETKVASNNYKAAYADLEATFKKHRDITLKFFRKDPEVLLTLGVKGRFPQRYNDFFDATHHFYSTIQNNAAIQQKVQLIKITPEVVTECLAKHQDLLNKRSDYDREEGETQDATQTKNAALIELDEWMDEFDRIAEVALYDQPQLLEVLGIFVRS